VAELRERISVSKRARENFYLERLKLRKLDNVEVKENTGWKSQTDFRKILGKISNLSKKT
jgi:hypothetical protein